MAYKRKKDRYDIDANYGYGWETVSSYDNLKDAKSDLREYQTHVAPFDGAVKIVKRREAIA